MATKKKLARYLPILDWGSRYNKETLTGDLIAAIIVTIMLIPQSLAYALVAGLPAEYGLYASMLPLVAFAIFGTSMTLAVGPVAVISLLTASAIDNLGLPAGSPEYISAAIVLAFLSGIFLIITGLLKLGFLANFLSHPVIAGFITASGILIAFSQLKHILGIPAHGHSLYEVAMSLMEHIEQINIPTLIIGLSATAFLFWVRKGLKPLLMKMGLKAGATDLLVKTGPVLAIIATTLAAWGFNLEAQGLKLVGDVPSGLPSVSVPSFDLELWKSLIGSAVLLSIIGFVESVSVAQTLAAKRRQRIDPDQELIALGASNTASALSSGFPVTGGFSRSVVNFDAGAQTPAAGAFTAVGLAIATLTLTPLLAFLPKATLAATIIVAVLSLVDFSILKKTWNYSKADFLAVASTILITLGVGVEMGVSAGVLLSILIHLYKSSRPHTAIVGQVPGSEHYRNVDRHEVITQDNILTVRVDESLYFANARFLEDTIYDLIAKNHNIEHVILMCSAVNALDMSALESLESINERLKQSNVKFHLSEVKGPVCDRLQKTDFIEHLSGNVYLSQHTAIEKLVAQK